MKKALTTSLLQANLLSPLALLLQLTVSLSLQSQRTTSVPQASAPAQYGGVYLEEPREEA
jgi:hypothetical protein